MSADDNPIAVRSTVASDRGSVPEFSRIDRPNVARKVLKSADFRNRYVDDLNALDTTFENCDFRYSIIRRGYFRNAKFSSCLFDGARFEDCNFGNSTLYTCSLKYTLFRRCELDIKQVVASIPAEPNLRRDSLRNLRANAIEVGDFESISMLTLQEAHTAKRHYWYALRGYDSYYREKYGSAAAKIEVGIRWLAISLSGLVWGHGERPIRLLFTCASLLLLLSLANIWSVAPREGWESLAGGTKSLEYVVRTFLGMSVDTRFQGFEIVDYLTVLLRYLYIGLFISVLYKAISRR